MWHCCGLHCLELMGGGYIMSKSSNATASAFGWEFQSNAAIMLMIKNIFEASKVKVEGENEDIEITFFNRKRLMAQAKAVENPDIFKNVKRKLEEGLRTLNAAFKIADVEKLIFVTNSPNPFNIKQTMYKFSSPLNAVPYSELPSECQRSINDICSKNGYDMDTSMLTICVMQFHGESEDERYKVLQFLTAEFLQHLGVDKVSSSQVLSLWQNSFRVNASQRTSEITKESMIWPIIAIQCEARETDIELDDYDASDVSEILQKYRAVINNNSERFEFVLRVISDFNDFCPSMKTKQRVEKFVSERWEFYKSYFGLHNTDSVTEEVVVRLTLLKILKSRRVIAEIKGKVKL